MYSCRTQLLERRNALVNLIKDFVKRLALALDGHEQEVLEPDALVLQLADLA